MKKLIYKNKYIKICKQNIKFSSSNVKYGPKWKIHLVTLVTVKATYNQP